MKKKLLLSMAAIIAVTVGIIGMSAFEAHIINVTAKIENALSVTPDKIEFGTVFPQEYLERDLTIALSQSFMDEPRVDDVNYFIRQKPKPRPEAVDACFAGDETLARHWCYENRNEQSAEIFCPGNAIWDYFQVCYYNLCPYLSKHPDLTPENDGSLDAMHEMDIDVAGRLAKSEFDTEDIWTVDLDVPCFDGMCAQDWTHQGWELDPELESQVFGCDLWIEVQGISLPGDPYCGDGVMNQPEEECDDGNNQDGDGCTYDCLIDVGPICGNGILEGLEECDDGNNDDGDGCSANCTIEVPPTCGDGNLDPGEECDDNNNDDGDGCEADCTLPDNCNDPCLDNLGCGGGFICSANYCRNSNCPEEEDCECGIGCVDKADVMSVLDRSGSINSTELTTLKTAALAFVVALGPSSDGVHMGQSSFATTGSLDLHLTSNTTLINVAINGLSSGGFTNLGEGISLAKTELDNPGDGDDRIDAEAPDFMVIITDGEPNRPTNEATGQAAGITAATTAKNAGVTIYVVGVGTDPATTAYLRDNIATSPAHYFDAGDYSGLQTILQSLAECNGD